MMPSRFWFLSRKPEKESLSLELLENFHVHPWRWHHRSLVSDLRRLERWLTCPQEVRQRCRARDRKEVILTFTKNGASRDEAILQSYRFVMEENWRIHNFVEETIFFPWLFGKFPEASGTLRAFDERRNSLKDRQRKVLEQLEDSLVNKKVPDEGETDEWRLGRRLFREPNFLCLRKSHRAGAMLRSLSADLDRLFHDEEMYVVPLVATRVSAHEQSELNDRVLNSLDGGDARTSLVIFHEWVKHSNDETEWKLFRRLIPPPLRLLIPHFRARFYSTRSGLL